MHPCGETTVDRTRLSIDNNGVGLTLTRLRPEADVPWRNTEEARTSYYKDSNALVEVERTVRPFRAGPMFPSEEIEILWAHQQPSSGSWSLNRRRRSSFRQAAPVRCL